MVTPADILSWWGLSHLLGRATVMLRGGMAACCLTQPLYPAPGGRLLGRPRGGTPLRVPCAPLLDHDGRGRNDCCAVPELAVGVQSPALHRAAGEQCAGRVAA